MNYFFSDLLNHLHFRPNAIYEQIYFIECIRNGMKKIKIISNKIKKKNNIKQQQNENIISLNENACALYYILFVYFMAHYFYRFYSMRKFY